MLHVTLCHIFSSTTFDFEIEADYNYLIYISSVLYHHDLCPSIIITMRIIVALFFTISLNQFASAGRKAKCRNPRASISSIYRKPGTLFTRQGVAGDRYVEDCVERTCTRQTALRGAWVARPAL